MTRDQIVDELRRAEREASTYFGAFDTDAFFRKLGTAWSPAETVRHLSKGIRAVTKGVSMRRFVLRLLFGRARRPSVTPDELRTRYLGLLAAGGRAGRFAPEPREESDPQSGRARILAQFTRANDELVKAVGGWSERDLDRYQMPHPLLGKLTVREMLFFTVYHQHHHMAVTERRRGEMGWTG